MEYFILYLSFVLINIKLTLGTNSTIKRGLVNLDFEDINECSHVILERDSDGVVNCMMLCSNNKNCRSVSFNKLDSRCRLFSQDFSGQAPTGTNETGWIHLDDQDSTAVAPVPNDCSEVQSQGHTTSGLYDILIDGNQETVWCDLETEGGGWTVFQRRSDGSEDFDRVWNDYVTGFGHPSTEYWIGNDALNILTSSLTNELMILMETWEGVWKHARYSNFRVYNGTDKYRLLVEGYNGTAGDKLWYNSGKQFSTRDQDNDLFGGSCNPQFHSGGWWFGACTLTDLNGIFYSSRTIARNTTFWDHDKPSLRTVFMMLRKK